MIKILTEREMEIIDKKIKGLSLSQNESNILSKRIRPKLREMNKINANDILKKIEYNQKARSIDNNIRQIILQNVPQVDSITLCGTAVQNNYTGYNDIDVIVATKKVLKDRMNKKKLINETEKEARKYGLILDLQIYAKTSILEQYPNNPSLIYQLKDSKTIYGKLEIPKKIAVSSLDLRMKLDWSEGLDMKSNGDEIYYAIRNAMLVLLLMHKKVDNQGLRENLNYALGADLINKLRKNNVSKLEKKLSLSYLILLVSYLEKELKNPKWERIEIESR